MDMDTHKKVDLIKNLLILQLKTALRSRTRRDGQMGGQKMAFCQMDDRIPKAVLHHLN